MNRYIFVLILLLCLAACQESPSPEPLPTLMRFPTLAPSATFSPTLFATLNFTYTPSATITDTAIPTTLFPSETLLPSNTPLPSATATALPEAFIFGRSAGQRDLIAYRFGTGSRVIMLVGGIHAGFEANTSRLMEELQGHFANNPQDIRSGITILMIPALNPDGAALGRILQGRFNGNSVDLNRNWGCGWREEAFFGQSVVDAGEEAFSEPETRALGSLIQRVLPASVLFYHAAANGVYAGGCEDDEGISQELAAIYGEASGYPYGEAFSDYVVTGTAPAWVDSIGIPSVDIELASADATEFVRNLRAILVLQDWVLGQ